MAGCVGFRVNNTDDDSWQTHASLGSIIGNSTQLNLSCRDLQLSGSNDGIQENSCTINARPYESTVA